MDLSQFLLEVHETSMTLSPEDFQLATLERMRRYVDFDFGIWGAGDGVNRELHTATVLDQTDELFSTWEPVKEEDAYANLVIGNTGRTWTLDQVPRVFETRAYNEHWALYRARHMASTMQIDPVTGLHVFVTLARDRSDSPFSTEELQFKNLVTRHLFLAARHNDRKIDNSTANVALMDRQGLLHACAPGFANLLTQKWAIKASRKLPAGVCEDLWLKREHLGYEVRLLAEPAGSRLLVRAEPISAPALSPRESEIAWAYARGQNHKAVAQAMSISPATVRNHLSRVYQKLGVKDKGALALWLSGRH